MNEETIFDTKVGNNEAQTEKVKSNNVVNEPNNLKSNSKKQETAAGNKQKKTMNVAGVAGVASAAGVAGAAIGMAIPYDVFSENYDDGNNGGTSTTGHGTSTGFVGHELKVATGVNDSMSFNEAFAAAREEVGAGGIFVWHGKPYGTYYENEWNAMSPEDKNQYWADVYHTVQNNEYLQEQLNNGTPTTGTGAVNPGVGGGGNPDPDPDPIQKPDIGPDGELILTSDQILEEVDRDGDGVVDMLYVDVDGNDIPDVVLDSTGDGNYDMLLQDAAIVDNDIIALGDEQQINGIHIQDEVDPYQSIDPEPPIVCDNPDLDPLASNIPDPNIPIDNNMNMGEFV